jgi:galactokinase
VAVPVFTRVWLHHGTGEPRRNRTAAASPSICQAAVVSGHASAFAPGRVNLIGEHTDYNLGLALPFTIDDGVTVRATARHTGRRRSAVIEAVAVDLGQRDSFELSRIVATDGWRAFVRGAVAELQRAGLAVPAASIELTGTVPRGAGLSSSAALEVALCLALLALADEPVPGDRIKLAELCSRIENEWVGARSGLLDQIAVLFGTPMHATLIDFRSLHVRPIPIDLSDHRLVIVDSGQARTHSASGYNERRAECERACAALGLSSLRDATLAQARGLPDPLARRVRHVITENARVQEAVGALIDRDVQALGQLLNASHESLRDDYEVSTAAVERTREELLAAGALGARLIGGGFGGHVLGVFEPGAELPRSARLVAPGANARLL